MVQVRELTTPTERPPLTLPRSNFPSPHSILFFLSHHSLLSFLPISHWAIYIKMSAINVNWPKVVECIKIQSNLQAYITRIMWSTCILYSEGTLYVLSTAWHVIVFPMFKWRLFHSCTHYPISKFFIHLSLYVTKFRGDWFWCLPSIAWR
jgi:hypothetical protein